VQFEKNSSYSFWEIRQSLHYCQFLPVFRPFLPDLTNFGRFNQNGVFTGERCYDEPSFGAIRKKLTTRFLRKLHLSPQNGPFWPKNGHKMVKNDSIKNQKNSSRDIDPYYHSAKFEKNSPRGFFVIGINAQTDRPTDRQTDRPTYANPRHKGYGLLAGNLKKFITQFLRN